MKIIIEAENEDERGYKYPDGRPAFPMTFLMVRRFALTGQSVAGDIDWYEGNHLALFGDLERIKRIVEFRLVERMNDASNRKSETEHQDGSGG